MRLLRSIATISVFTLGSRVVGFLRTILMAAFVGSGAMADALVIAMKIPSVLRRIFAEGAFNAAFVPLFAGALEEHGKDYARQFANQIFSVLIFSLSVVILLIEVFMPEFLSVIVHGFDIESARFSYTVMFTRITLPFILFISICALYSGILNSLEKFVFAASSPMIGNIAIIASVFALKTITEDQGTAFAIGITICGLIQSLWVMIPAKHEGFLLKPVLIKLTTPVRNFFKLLLPAALGAGVVQVNIFLDMIIASHLPDGGISYLEYADRLNQLPLSTIGVAMGTALLPMLTKQLRGNQIDLAMKTQNTALQYAIMLALPATIGLFILATPIVEVVYTHGKLTYDRGIEIAKTLRAFSLGLPAFIIIKVATSIFYAHKDTKTPVIVGVCCTGLNVILNIILMQFYQHVGLAMATSVAAYVNALTLFILLLQQERFSLSKNLRMILPKLVLIAMVMITSLLFLKAYFWPQFRTSQMAEICALAVMISTGVGLFLALSIPMGILKKKDFIFRR